MTKISNLNDHRRCLGVRSSRIEAGRLVLMAVLLLSFFFLGSAGTPGLDSPDSVDFGRDILPILSDKCFPCHGPDAKTRKADLRLDVEEGLLRKDDPVIVPGRFGRERADFAGSSSLDELEQMPPKRSKLTLEPGQVELLKRWVDQGARWGGHWAFVPTSDDPKPPRTARE